MTQTRLIEIIVYLKELRTCAHKRICRSEEGSRLEAEAEGNYTSLTHVLSILRREVKTHTNT